METQITKNLASNMFTNQIINNDYLCISIAENGLFNSYATGIITGSSYNISFSSPDSPVTSVTTIEIDGVNYVYGISGILIEPPTELPNLKNESIYKYRNIQVKQTLQIVEHTSAGHADTGMYKYTVTNNDTIAHNIGLRIMIDTMIDDNDGAPFNIPGVGTITHEMEFIGSDIPQHWQIFHSLNKPNITAQGTLIGGAATTPDKFVIAAWPNIKVTSWDYTVNTAQSITTDSAAAIYWNPCVVEPGKSHEFITLYGLSATSITGNIKQNNSQIANIDETYVTRGINVFRC